MKLSYYLRKKISYNELTSLIKQLIYDIESNCHLYRCYAYPKTIRSILTGSTYSEIAYHFNEKKYFGIFVDSIYLSEIIMLLDKMCGDEIITYTMSNNKKLYKSIKHEVDTTLSKKDIKEINSLIDIYYGENDE